MSCSCNIWTNVIIGRNVNFFCTPHPTPKNLSPALRLESWLWWTVVSWCLCPYWSLLDSWFRQGLNRSSNQSPSSEYSSKRNEVSCVEVYTHLFIGPLATVNRQWRCPPADAWVKNVVHVRSRKLVCRQKEQEEKHHMTSRVCEIRLKGETQRESCRLPGERNSGVLLKRYTVLGRWKEHFKRRTV